MKSFLPPIWLSFLVLIFLLRCSSQPSNPTEIRTVANEDVEAYVQALSFDKFATGQMQEKESSEYKKDCEKKFKTNPFCYSVVHYEELINPQPKEKNTHTPKKHSAIFPKIKKGKIINWYDLRYSNVQSILKGLSGSSPKEIEKVKEYAFKEVGCPNHAAIAVAADLEDKLPDQISYAELARLYEKGAQCAMDEINDQEALLTRAGIFYFAAKNYAKAKEVLKKSSEFKEAYHARAYYWLYQSHLILSEEKEANEVFNHLRMEYPFTFHTLVIMTSKKLDPGTILDSNWDPKITRSEQKSQINIYVEQYEILKRFKFQKTAEKVLNWALRDTEGTEPQFRMYLAELKESDGDHLKKFYLMSDVLYNHPELISRKTMEQYFPKVYFPIFEKNSQGIDPLLLVSIARRESAFNARAVSSADARGLLQVTPRTLKEMNYKKDLFDPESNVFIGAKRFSDLLEKVNGQIHLALAAYNAGPKRLDDWLNRYPISDPILFSDLIPFRETREYVAAVLRNYYWYRRIHGNTDNDAITVIGSNTSKPFGHP